MSFVLSDDGTLDTVIKCSGCGREYRFNWDGEHDCESGTEGGDCDCYAQFVAWAIDDANESHDCLPRATPRLL